MEIILYLAPIAGILALLVALFLTKSINSADAGTDRMKEIASFIHEGAMAFLKSEYKFIAIFVAVLFVVLAFTLGLPTAICFLFGAVLSVLAGFCGMSVATKANVRTANAARTTGLAAALKIAFRGGAVMGLCVVGFGIVGVTACYLIFGGNTVVLTGFGLGASSIALFGRVGGGM